VRQFKVPGAKPVRQQALGGERKRLVWLSLGAIFLVVAILAMQYKRAYYRGQEGVDLPSAAVEMEEAVLLPEIDAARLDALVADEEAVDRVMLEGEALDYLLADVRTLTARHFEAMDTVELDAAGVERILADPSAHRGEPYLARGAIDAIRTRRRGPTNEQEHLGRLTLEDGSTVYFLVLDAPENAGFVRVDGLFLKVYSDEEELAPGEWIEGPLLVGPRAIRSYRSLGEVTEPHWGLLAEVEDADLVPADGSQPKSVSETPFDALWYMMAYARDVPEGAVDWEAAPELDHEHLQAVVHDPQTWRGQPFRIPISRIQDARVLRATENPARIESFTQGWIGNTTWKNVVHFKYPIPDREIRLRDYAYGRGFFLHNFSYASAGRGLRVAPLFILQSLTRFEPQPDPRIRKLVYAIVGVCVFLGGLMVVLLARDRRRAAALQRELARRRQARRNQRSQRSVGTASS